MPLPATWQAANGAASLSWRPGQAVCLTGATKSAAMSARSLLWTKDYANMLSGPPATGPGTSAGFRQLGQLAKTHDFIRRFCCPADTSGSRSKDYKGEIPAV